MSKAEQTKQKIIEKAAITFNQNGYAGSSIGEIMKLTGLRKSGFYHHFKSKEEIAVAAFDYTLGLILEAVMAKVGTANTAIDRLNAFIDTFRGFTTQPIAVGGCPILNTAVESDDTHPRLRLHVQEAVNEIRALIDSIIELGIRQNEILDTTDREQVSTIILVTIEGAIMMSKLYGTDIYLDRAIEHLHQYINGLAR
ncbi:TetR/AcrR family transcriptional regulator [Chamaesiphon polymorphus]|uniref:TetR/AcrR family transcriptional regulator n=1 Tax=Chamaesiphon polymorphus CCALA 037 TaxID=2107692 RepID=A0A2T1GMP1_9CYAN|nr:TetR/AcrR family transcriptional regulator [Chamaesiphon polymorphus]PSB59066.1 TetR/AcrR family transcriptional regulator [Chamaesiphon polymorphus CCALA 037]